MATRFYLPASGTAPLGSLAVDSSWGRSENLERRPCGTIKSNTSLTQKSAAWANSATNDWVWVQFQSKKLAAGYSWTTSDTVSMVIKVAEAAAQVDSHLAYCIRVVSGDGTVVRGIVGVYQATSSEYPTSLASIATRIHDARTDGASNFSSQAGDRIIIEIGHWGVTPTLNTVYHNYGDPSATQDFPLTAGDTNDYCPWVELSRDVSFDLTDTQPAYTKGRTTATATPLPAYTEGANPSYPVSDSQLAFVYGRENVLDIQNAYTKGSSIDVSHVDAYTKGTIFVLDNQNAYTKGLSTILDNINSFVLGSVNIIVHIDGYTKGSAVDVTSKSAYTSGSFFVNDSLLAYTEGFSIGGDASTSKSIFVIGLDNTLIPDGDINKVGVWKNELEQTTNLYQSIDELTPNDSDYIYDVDPTGGDYVEFSLSNPAGAPGPGDVVVLWRGKDITGLGKSLAHIELKQGDVIISSGEQVLTIVPSTYYFTITPEQKSSITDWTDLRIRITVIIL